MKINGVSYNAFAGRTNSIFKTNGQKCYRISVLAKNTRRLVETLKRSQSGKEFFDTKNMILDNLHEIQSHSDKMNIKG